MLWSVSPSSCGDSRRNECKQGSENCRKIHRRLPKRARSRFQTPTLRGSAGEIFDLTSQKKNIYNTLWVLRSVTFLGHNHQYTEQARCIFNCFFEEYTYIIVSGIVI